MQTRRRPGEIRDAICHYLSEQTGDATIADITSALEERFCGPVTASSVRSALNIGVDDLYERTGRGRYQLKSRA